MAKARYTKPTAQLDLEERSKSDYVPPTVLRAANDPDPTTDDGFINVSPEYRNFANATDAPIKATKGAEAKVFEEYYHDETDFNAGATADGEEQAEAKKDEPSSPPSGSSQTPSQSTSQSTSTGSTPPPSGGVGAPPSPSGSGS